MSKKKEEKMIVTWDGSIADPKNMGVVDLRDSYTHHERFVRSASVIVRDYEEGDYSEGIDHSEAWYELFAEVERRLDTMSIIIDEITSRTKDEKAEKAA